MNESTNGEHLPDVDVRPNAGIVRSPLDEIKAIQTLLADVYKDAGDGRTLFRELIQNADDAGAQQFGLVVLERGWPDAQNSLLHGPALLVVNDGAFTDKDREALHKAIGGSKEDEIGKIGTFGIGLKSVFHLCEAFLYIGAEKSEWRAGVLNPWAGTGEKGDADPLHPDWDKIDVERLRSVATELLGNTSNCLLLWIPLRRPEHRDRGAEDRQYGLGERCPQPDDLSAWFGCSSPAALLLAQCGHLQTIDAERAAGPESLRDRVRLVRVARRTAGWVGRYEDDGGCFPDRTFEGEILSDDQSWSVVGVEARGSERLNQIRSLPDWPQSPQWENGRYSSVPRKALAHAAVTVLRPSDLDAERPGTRLRWAAFLPLDDDPVPQPSAIVESQGPSPAWEIILHGYFWPSQDRRSIPGVTDRSGSAASDGDMRIRWNSALYEDLLLPLLPSALANAVVGVDDRVARKLLDAVVRADMVKNRLDTVMRRHWLLPIVAACGVRWKALPARSYPVLSIPKWSQASEVVGSRFVASCDECTDEAMFIDDDAPRLTGELDDWTDDRLERLLNCIPHDVFGSPQSLRWVEVLVRHVLGPEACGGDVRAAAVARWLAGRVGDGALAHTTRRSASHEELREAWRSLCEALPKSWLLDTPVETQQAVAELAAGGAIGEGLFPVPFGRRRGDPPSAPQLDQERLDRALCALGRRMKAEGESERLRRSRLLLAEVLLSRRDHRPMDAFYDLPLLRAMRLPEGQEEAWSIAELGRQSAECRVFASLASRDSDYDGMDATQPDRPSDPKRAIMELAEALDEAIWMVSGDAVSSIAVDVPSPAPTALASAVLRAGALADPAHRKPLLMRLAPRSSDNGDVRSAARVLLAGRAAVVDGEDAELFHDHAGNGRALPILLRLIGRSWCAVPGSLVAPLSQDILEVLSVSQADHRALHRLLGDCLGKLLDWTGLSDGEALQLLQDLYGATPEQRERWRAMPLHRGIDGKRGAFNQRALRSTGKTGELRLPPELEAEVRLLDPEPQVGHLYDSVPHMDRDGFLKLLLEDRHPRSFAEQVVHCVRSPEGPVLLPQDGELRNLLRRSRWLPLRDGGALAPDAVLIAPQELLDAVAGLAAAGAFGDKRLPEAIDPGIWGTAEPVVRAILGHLSRERQAQRIVDALDSALVGRIDRGAWLVSPDPKLVDASLIACALETTLTNSHPGWKLVRIVKDFLGYGGSGSRDDSEPLVKLARALCAPVPSACQIEMLKRLAAIRPAKDSPSGRMFRRLLNCFTETDGFFGHVLPEIDLPTQDGNWHASRDVARTETGVARRHRLISELRPILQLTSDDRVPLTSHVGGSWTGSGLDTLEKYFKPWYGRVPRGAVGAFLSLLGNGLNDVIGDLAQKWLGEDVAIESIGSLDRHAISVWVKPQVAYGDRVSAVNVLGSWVEMEAEPDDDTLFAIDPIRYPSSQYSALAPLGGFWELALRDVKPHNRSGSDLMQLLGGTVKRWASRYLGLPREEVNAWWSRWGERSQADFGPVLASIKAHLPLTLQQLDVKDSDPLRDALRKAERAQRKREQAPSDKTLEIESKALDRLATLIKEPEQQTFLWNRVNVLMRRYGYGPDSALLELAQNADDALTQAAEIKAGALPPATRRLLIQVHELDGTTTVDVMHWGRPLNDTGGAAFPAGRERQWDQDLYFMMLMNLSGKPGEVPGEPSSFSTTGRFGLGFKSVHLVSSSTSVVSGFIAFSIAGGLLPQERAVPDETDSWMIEGRLPTRVRLPLRSDLGARIQIEQVFRRFAYAHVLLPVLARQVREVVVEGGPFPGVHVFDGKTIDGAPGWSVGAETELPSHHGRWRILRFRPADAGREDMGTTALVVGLRDGVPTALGPDVPFLWNVTPTSENWGYGYVVNGPFKLDPGRTHVSLDDDTTLGTVGGLGAALGRGLIALHNVLVDSADASHGPLNIRDVRGFLSSLWRVLACGLDNPDALRGRFLRELHGNGRGLSAWMGACSAVPSGLPAPFQPMLPPLTSDVRIEVATGDFDNHLCVVLAEIEDEDLARMVGGRCIVSEEIEQLLRPHCSLVGTEGDYIAPTPLHPSDLFAELAERWGHCLTPERLHALRPIDGGGAPNFDTYDPQSVTWRGSLEAQAADGSLQPLRNLLLQEAPDRLDHTDADTSDELLRAAFAPDNRVLDPVYIERSEDWRVFRWLRVQHRVDAEMMAEWCVDLPEGLHSAAIHYLLYGELGFSVLQRLEQIEGRPRWVREYDDVRRLVEDQCEESWRRQSLLGALFPDRFRAPEPPPDPIRPDSDTFFQRLSDWWGDATVRSEVIAEYERHAWPEWLRGDGIAGGLQHDSDDHWLALLVLGACRSLGRTRDDQHRGFLELAHREGWWEVFKTPDDAGAWMEVLRDWQDNASDKLPYLRWMSLFPMIYQFSRYREKYARLLKSAGQRPESMYQVAHLLAPRIDEALTGAGTHFNAPPAPLNMGLHWAIRELVRLKVVEGEHLFPDCWVPSEQVLRLLDEVGLVRPDDNVATSRKARAIFDFLSSGLETRSPNLHLAFDVPLRHVARNESLRRRLGLQPNRSNEKIHRTSRGDWVRSKSEVVIANELFSRNIEYEYETQLTLTDGTWLQPDFTIKQPHGAPFYWEHLGMLNDPDYRQRWEDKLKMYRQSNILPLEEGGGDTGTLIVTQDDESRGMDASRIADTIRQHLSPVVHRE